jgi:hypothetical protein
MQLSAPTLPVDSSSKAGGFPPVGGKGESNALATADFGEILSAESHGSRSDDSAADASPLTTHKNSTGVAAEEGTAGFPKNYRVDSFLEQNAGITGPETTPESLAAVAGLILPSVSVVPAPESAGPGISLTVTSGETAADGSEVDSAGTASESAVSSTTSSNASGLLRGRPFQGEMLNGKSRASIRAYGLRGEGRPSQSTIKGQPPLAVGELPVSTFSTPITPAPTAAVFAPVTTSQGATVTSNSLVSPQTTPNKIEEFGVVLPAGVVSPEEKIEFVTPEFFAQGTSQPASLNPSSAATEVMIEPSIGETSVPSNAQSEDISFVPEANQPAPSSFENSLETVLEADIEPHHTEAELHVAETESVEPQPGTLNDATEVLTIELSASVEAVAEKIAAHLSRVADRVPIPEKMAQRISLAFGQKDVATSYGRIGINVAKPEVLMPATASIPTPATVAMENASINSMPLSFDSLVKDGHEGSAGQLAQISRRAVESVLTVADHLASGEQRSVRLQFTVGGEDLAVRVELRGDKVHTTFRTDSSELRSVLAQEWQSVSGGQSGVRTQRLADPVFASSSSSGSGQHGMSSDSGSTHQRDPRQPHFSSEQVLGSRRAIATTPTAPVAAAATPVTASLNSLRLQTFA